VKQKTQQEDLMVSYLLGDLPEEEQIQIEERFFTNDDYFEQVCSVEDALVDDYAQESLTESERGKVERLLLASPRQAREIKFVRELIRHVSETPSEELPEPNFIPVERPGKWQSLLHLLHSGDMRRRFSLAVTLLLIMTGIYMAIWNRVLQREIRQMQTRQAALEERDQELRQLIGQQANGHEAVVKELESERERREQLEEELAALQASRPLISTNEIAILDLKTDSFTRGDGELQVVAIQRGVSRLQIRFDLDQDDYKLYSAVIKTFEGREVWSKDQIRPGKGNLARIVLTLPASILANHDYILTLKGQTESGGRVEIGDYPFRVKR
jgi:predicted ribosome quality control (RQC) complex YloA/Tae2 family protein